MPVAHTINTSERLSALRGSMATKENGVQAYVVPTQDEHCSEYVAEADKRREFISGFSGSSGTAIVTTENAFLFTDGRYFLQAAQQLDSNWTLMKVGLPDVPSWQEFLSKNLDSGSRIGIDPTLITISDAETISKALQPRGSHLMSVEQNLVDDIWKDRPQRPHNPVHHLDEKFSGQSHRDKVQILRKELAKKKYPGFVLSMLDEIAWLFNLRGSDIRYNPVFFAYAVVTVDTVELFINKAQLGNVVLEYIEQVANVRRYEEFFSYLREFPSQLSIDAESKIVISGQASLAIATALGKDSYVIADSPVAELKAIKNTTELEGFRHCHIRDGAALARYFAWLEEQLEGGGELTEVDGANMLELFRSKLDLFRGLSFDTISASGANAAIIHYKPEVDDCAIIKKDQMYLCDSGGQYLDGTTDVTRTWHFGTPTTEEKRAFTRVLQGHIAIDTAVFPNGTTGYMIDSFARKALWKDGLDYRHGTGHGVGHYLNVHEGPQGIGTRIALNKTPLKAGMTLSNEPGYYADGQYGVRIESIVLVKDVQTPNNFGDKGYLGFERVTFSPIHKKLVDLDLLTVQERNWLNDYHAETWEKVSPLLKNENGPLNWLRRECAPL